MTTKSHFTTREIADLYGQPVWLVRRAIDALGVDIPRAGLYRLVPVELLGRVRQEVQRRIGRPVEEVARA